MRPACCQRRAVTTLREYKAQKFLNRHIRITHFQYLAGVGRNDPARVIRLVTLAQPDHPCVRCHLNQSEQAGEPPAMSIMRSRKPTSSFDRLRCSILTQPWHDNRHTLITDLAESGASDQTIMDIAGHVSKQMLKHYSHIRMEAKRTALESIVQKEPAEPVESEQNHAPLPTDTLHIEGEYPRESPRSGNF